MIVYKLRNLDMRFLAVCLTGLIIITSTQAESVPKSSRDNGESLLGIVVERVTPDGETPEKGRNLVFLNGPDELRLSIGKSEREILWFVVDPASYTLEADEMLEVSGGIPNSVTVPSSSIVLAPFRLSAGPGGIRNLQIDESLRQWAGRELALQINYPEWSGRDLIGFGTLRPSLDPETLRFQVEINSEQDDSEVYIDDVLMGQTPLQFEMTGGKYRILVRSSGFEDAIYYVRLEGDAQIDAALLPLIESEDIPVQDLYATLVGPFIPLGEPDEQLSRLFADTLLLTLEDDERLRVLPSAIPWVKRDSLLQPDFLKLEETGTDLVVSGFFGEKDGSLAIQANLYDVQAETVRAAVTWYGAAGLDIFDAMDQIAAEFADEVDRVLPAAGRILITRKETVFSAVGKEENLLSRKKIIRKRWEDSPNVLTIEGGFGGNMTRFDLNDSGNTNTIGQFEGPGLSATLSWDRDLGPNFAMGAGTMMTFGTYRTNEMTDENASTWSLSVFTGPRLIFRSLKADITLGMDLSISYFPRVTYYWDVYTADVGSLLTLELPIKVGFRFYFNKRIDRMPLFMTGSLGVAPLGYRFDLGDTGQEGMTDPGLIIRLGLGIRL